MIQIGKKYELISIIPENNGLIVTVIGHKGTHWQYPFQGERWYIDIELKNLQGEIVNHVGEKQLKPIYDGDEKVTWESMKDIWIPDSLCV